MDCDQWSTPSSPASFSRISKLPMSTPHRLSRRAFLRGAGVTLALPLLEAMTPFRARAAAAETPRRMLCINTSLGLHTPNLYPEAAGKDYALTPYLEVIKDFRSEF